MPSHIRSRLSRVASLLMLGVGVLVLLGDSADDSCPKGVSAARFDATFRSTCPTRFIPAEGTVRIALEPGDVNKQLSENLAGAGVLVSNATVIQNEHDGLCTPGKARFALGPGAAPVPPGSNFYDSCTDLSFSETQQEVLCRKSGTTRTQGLPVVLQLGPRDFDAGSLASPDGGAGGGDGAEEPAVCSITFTKVP